MEKDNKYGNNSKLEIIEKFCKHLADGYSKECFVDFDYTEVHRMAEEIDKENKNTYCNDLIEQGYRKYRYFWEKAGIENMRKEILIGSDRKIVKFDRNIWMFLYKIKRETKSGQESIPFEGMNVISLKTNS